MITVEKGASDKDVSDIADICSANGVNKVRIVKTELTRSEIEAKYAREENLLFRHESIYSAGLVPWRLVIGLFGNGLLYLTCLFISIITSVYSVFYSLRRRRPPHVLVVGALTLIAIVMFFIDLSHLYYLFHMKGAQGSGVALSVMMYIHLSQIVFSFQFWLVMCMGLSAVSAFVEMMPRRKKIYMTLIAVTGGLLLISFVTWKPIFERSCEELDPLTRRCSKSLFL